MMINIIKGVKVSKGNGAGHDGVMVERYEIFVYTFALGL